MRTIGLHLRINESLTHTARHAKALGLRSFQCFVTLDTAGKFFSPTDDDIAQFCQLQNQFDALFLHASYYINPASCRRTHHPILEREIKFAKRLKVPYLILHPGVASNRECISQGIEALARVINCVHKQHKEITLVLENTAHGNRAVGSDFKHLKQLLDRVEDKERVRFCIDTAHAYAYGYDISDFSFHEAMIDLIDETIGIERVMLIHLNDTKEQLSSYIDRHCVIGEGLIGQEALQAFVTNKRLGHIPLILELPAVAEGVHQKMIRMVSNW